MLLIRNIECEKINIFVDVKRYFIKLKGSAEKHRH